jgi:hypothetical protein
MATGVASNGEIVLRPSKRKWLGVMSIGLFFVASSKFMIVDRGGVLSWPTTIFFAGCALVAIIQLFPTVDSHLKCKAGFCEDFEWGEIVESLSWSIVESIRHVCKGVV